MQRMGKQQKQNERYCEIYLMSLYHKTQRLKMSVSGGKWLFV